MSTRVILEVALGLAVIYFLVCIFSTAIREIVARAAGERGKFLRQALTNLLPDRWVCLRVINHPMISTLYREVPGKGATPSYIPAGNFAHALLDTLVRKHALAKSKTAAFTLDAVHKAVRDAKDKDLAIGHALLPMVERADSLDAALKNVEGWYDSGMARVSGWYKARSQKVLFAIGLATAVIFNIDSIQIASTLARSEGLRQSLVITAERLTTDTAIADTTAETAEAELVRLAGAGLPIGYACVGKPAQEAATDRLAGITLEALATDCWTQIRDTSAGYWVVKLAGWLLTALATALGAPFWFDALNRVISMRSSGARPAPAAKTTSGAAA